MISRRVDDAWGFMVGAGLAGYASYSAITHTVTKHSSNVIMVGESGDLGAAITALLFLLGAFVMIQYRTRGAPDFVGREE